MSANVFTPSSRGEMSGGDIKEILGHQNLETTCRFYLGQLTKAEVRKAFNVYMHYEVPMSEAPQPPAVR